MNALQSTTRSVAQVRTLPLRRRALSVGFAAVVAGMLSFAGTSHAQEGPATPAPHAQHFRHGPMNPEQASKRLDRMIARLVPDATPAQKAKLHAIAKATFDDLRPLRKESFAAHKEVMKLLAQPTIDRNALEQARTKEQQLNDQRSRRVTQALADAADVLTPAQRAKAIEKLEHHHPHRHFRHHHAPAAQGTTPAK